MDSPGLRIVSEGQVEKSFKVGLDTGDAVIDSVNEYILGERPAFFGKDFSDYEVFELMETAPREIWELWAALQLVSSPGDLDGVHLVAARVAFDNKDTLEKIGPWDIPTFGRKLKASLNGGSEKSSDKPIWDFIVNEFIRKNEFIKTFSHRDALIDSIVTLALKIFSEDEEGVEDIGYMEDKEDRMDIRVLVEVLQTHVELLETLDEPADIQELIEYLRMYFLEEGTEYEDFRFSFVVETMAPWFERMTRDEIIRVLEKLESVLTNSLERVAV